MKINEFKQVNEGLSDWLVNLGTFMGGRPSKGKEHAKVRDMFMDDFIEDFRNSMDAAIKGGLVDTSKTSATSGPSPTSSTGAAGDTSPKNPTAGGADSQAKNKQQAQTVQNMNNYVKNVASTLNKETDKNKKIALTKELINFMADRKGYPEWENAMSTAKAILQKNNAGGNMLKALQSGQKVAEAFNMYWMHKLLEAVKLTWKDLGLSVLLETKKNRYIIAESVEYVKMNAIFENVLNEEDGGDSVSEFLMQFFTRYMKGVNWKKYEGQVKSKLLAIEKAYNAGAKESAIIPLAQELGEIAYAASKASPTAPEGMKDEMNKVKGGAGPQKVNVDKVRDAMVTLQKSDPAAYKTLIKSLPT